MGREARGRRDAQENPVKNETKRQWWSGERMGRRRRERMQLAGYGEGGGGRVSDDGLGAAQRADSGAKTPERPRQAYMTTLSEGESLLTAWYQRGGGGRVQAPGFLSPRKRSHLRPCPQRSKYAATDPKGPAASGRTCFVPVKAKTVGCYFCF